MRRLLLCVWMVARAAACSSADTQPDPPRPVVVGSESDAHGCEASAGYAWCERESHCVRPWELAREKGFELAGDGFARYCAKP
jgi:hypothetical protein